MEIKTLDELVKLISLTNTPESRTQYLDQIWWCIGKGLKIKAIKLYREQTNADLHTAKTHIENLIEMADKNWDIM